jgi:hypothetical protein
MGGKGAKGGCPHLLSEEGAGEEKAAKWGGGVERGLGVVA